MAISGRLWVGLTLLFSIQTPQLAFAESEESRSIDPIQGVTITVAAGFALGGTASHYRSQIEAANQLHTRHTPVLSGTGADLIGRRQMEAVKLADLALEGTRRGDILAIDYIPGTVAEMRSALADLDSAKKLWEKRVIEISKELGKLNRRITVEKHALAKIPPTLEWHSERERALERLDRSERQFRLARNAELDAQARMHHVRGLYEATKMNLEISERTGRVSGAHIRMDFPIDEKSHAYLQGFVNRIAGPIENSADKQALHAARSNAPHVRISRIALPNLDRSIQLLKEARRGAWVAGIGVIVALEEIAIGQLAEGLKHGLEAVDVIHPRTSSRSTEP